MKKSKTRQPWAFALGALAIGIVGYACATPLAPEDVKLRPTTMTAGTATTRTATVGTTLQNEPAVVVRDQHNEPLPGQTVTFAVSSGTAPSPASVQTDDNGRAAPATWALPTTSGTVTLTASVSGTTIAAQTFTVTLNPGPANKVAVNNTTPSSNNQSAVAGSPVPVVPQVKVTDQYGNAVPNVAVTFAVTGGGGVVVPTTPVNTDAQGVAKVTSWTLGTSLGTNTLRATVAGTGITDNPLTFTATGTAGTPATIVVGGDGSSQGQTAIANTNVPKAPIVIVRDANGNPVSGVTVRFAIGGGNGKILSGSSDNTGQTTIDITSGTDGTAAIFAWRLGSVGSNTLNVSLPDHASVTTFVFTATGQVGPPASIAVSNQAWATTQASTVHGGSPSVIVKDAGGNAVANQTVTWGSPTNSTLSGAASSTTSSTGVAAFPKSTVNWTAGATVGETMSMVATVSGTSLSQTFSSTIVGTADTIRVQGGNNQSGSVSTPLATKPSVKVVDASGRPVPGVSVSFAVTAGGGTVSGTPAFTDSVGVATVGNWTLGPSVGSNNNTMRASLTSTPTKFVDFTASASAGAPASVVAKAGNPTSSAVASTVTVTVIVRDAGSNLVNGASVTFTPTGTVGNAAIVGTNPVTTGPNGEATVQWRLDTLARNNQITAVTNSVGTTLTVTGTALAASKLTITNGNNQTAPPSTTLPQSPTVRVTDQYNNNVSAVSVTFAAAAGTVNCGAGATSSCAVNSGSTGLASTTWTLGSATGTQTLQASLTATPAVTASFTATAGTGCSVTTHTLGTTVNGTIATSDCPSGSPASYYDKYRFTTGGQSFFRLTMRPTGFIGEVTRWFWPSTSTGYVGTSAASGDSVTSYSIVAAGTYDFDAGASVAGATGSYAVVTQLNPVPPTSWCSFYMTKGASHSHSLGATDCLYMSTNAVTTTNRASRSYFILLAAGESMTISMASSAVDSYLEVYDVTGTRTFVAFKDDPSSAATTEVLTITNSGTTRKSYEIRATHYLSGSSDTPKSGAYTLTIAP